MSNPNKHLKTSYKALYQEVERILFRHDPIGINFGDNKSEYSFETGLIIPRLSSARGEADVHNIIFEEFIRAFDESAAGRKNNQAYILAAKEIWKAWVNYSRPLT